MVLTSSLACWLVLAAVVLDEPVERHRFLQQGVGLGLFVSAGHRELCARRESGRCRNGLSGSA